MAIGIILALASAFGTIYGIIKKNKFISIISLIILIIVIAIWIYFYTNPY